MDKAHGGSLTGYGMGSDWGERIEAGNQPTDCDSDPDPAFHVDADPEQEQEYRYVNQALELLTVRYNT